MDYTHHTASSLVATLRTRDPHSGLVAYPNPKAMAQQVSIWVDNHVPDVLRGVSPPAWFRNKPSHTPEDLAALLHWTQETDFPPDAWLNLSARAGDTTLEEFQHWRRVQATISKTSRTRVHPTALDGSLYDRHPLPVLRLLLDREYTHAATLALKGNTQRQMRLYLALSRELTHHLESTP